MSSGRGGGGRGASGRYSRLDTALESSSAAASSSASAAAAAAAPLQPLRAPLPLEADEIPIVGSGGRAAARDADAGLASTPSLTRRSHPPAAIADAVVSPSSTASPTSSSLFRSSFPGGGRGGRGDGTASPLSRAAARSYGTGSAPADPNVLKPKISDYTTLGINDASDESALLGEYGEDGKRRGRCCGPLARLPWQGKLAIIVLAIATAIAGIGLIGSYVIAPDYVKQRMDATTLGFNRITLTNPHGGVGDDLGGFTIDAEAVLSGLSPLDGTLDPMFTTLFFNDATVATFTLPRVRALANVDNIIGLAAPVTIVDRDAFLDFGRAILLQDTVTFVLTGTATVSTTLAGITYHIGGVPFRKTITLPAAGGLRQNKVLEFSLTGSNATAAVATLVVAMENPSVMGISPMGDLAVDVTYNGVYMGTVLTSNASLSQGHNELSFAGRLTPASTDAANALISHYLAGDSINVTAQGVPWPTSIPLYVPLVHYVALNSSLQGSTTPLVADVLVDTMYLAPASEGDVLVELNATVVVNNPLGANSPLLVREIALNVSLEGGGRVVGQLVVPPTPVAAVELPPGPFAASVDGLWHARFTHPDVALRERMLQAPAPVATANISMSITALLSISETAADFGDFILVFLNNDTVQLGLVSTDPYAMRVQLDSALGNLSVHVPLQARTVVPGINGFPFVSVESFSVAGIIETPPAVVVDLSVVLVNPSPASFPLGENATLGIFVDGQRIGGSTAYGVVLAPGRNVLNLTGIIAPAPGGLAATSQLFTNYLKGLPGTATVVGESVFVGGDLPTPPWLTDAVLNISLDATLPGAANLTVFGEVELVEVSMDFSEATPNQPFIAGIVRGNLHLPFTIPVDVLSVNTTLIFTDVATGAQMAGVSLANQRADYEPLALPEDLGDGNAPVVGVLTVYLSGAPIDLYDEALFAQFMAVVLNSASAPVLLAGSASPLVQLVIGNISVSNVSIHQYVAIPGMSGLSNPPVVVTSVDILNTTTTSAQLVVGLSITNPSVLTGRLGSAALDLEYEGVVLTTAHVAELDVQPGANAFNSTSLFQLPDPDKEPDKYNLCIDFLARYLQGIDSRVRMLGTPTSSPFPLLAPAFSALNASASFPGLPERVVVNATLYVHADPFAPPVSSANGTLFVSNPLSSPLSLVNASLTVWMCQNENASRACLSPDYGPAIGYFYDGDLSLDPIVVAPHSLVRTKPYNITVLADSSADFTLFIEVALDGSATSKINGTITARVGELQAKVPYSQVNVPLTIQEPPAPPL